MADFDFSSSDPDAYLPEFYEVANYVTTKNMAKICNSDLSLMHINCRSISNKLQEVELLLSSYHAEILGVSETWLKNGDPIPAIDGYKFVLKNRDRGLGGGVGFFIQDNIKFNLIDTTNWKFEGFEYQLISISQRRRENIVVAIIYRPPGNSLKSFNKEFSEFLSYTIKDNKKTIIMGDFNINLLAIESSQPTNEFLNILHSFFMMPVFLKPTRIGPSSATLIDNIFTNISLSKCISKIIIDDISDHFPLHINIKLHETIKIVEPPKLHRKQDKQTKLKFKECLTEVDWSDVTRECESQNISHAYKLFLSKYQSLYNHCFPLTTVGSQSRIKKQEWMTPALLKSCKVKSKLYKTYLKNPTPENKIKFTKYRNRFKTIKQAIIRQHFSSKFLRQQGNPKGTWNIIKGILSRGSKSVEAPDIFYSDDGCELNSPTEIAEQFNKHFSDLGPNLAKKIIPPSKSFHEFLTRSPTPTMSFFPVSPDEIIQIVKELKTSHSCGLDGIDPCIAGEFIPLISNILSSLINCSLSTGSVPDDLKLAKVIPLHKSGDLNRICNYRPISILPYFSKIFEKAVYRRVESFLSRFSLLNNKQFGFRKNHSTYMPLLLLYSKIADALDRGEFTIGVFLDLSKAFDTVNHEILLSKLYHYGLRGCVLKWFTSYLSGRKQLTEFNGFESSFSDVACGVPQGSILGPLLFIIYINDLHNSSSLLTFLLFADDTNVFASGKNLNDLIISINRELTNVDTWFRANKLSLNVDKTNFMLFCSKNKDRTHSIQPCINNLQIKHVTSTKFLGIIIDDRLNWFLHINYVASKISKNIGIMSRVSSFVDKKILIMLYYSLIYPYLIYCNIAWASTYPSKLIHLLTLQKRIIRTIFRLHPRAHTKDFFISNGLLNIYQINKFQTCLFIYNYEHNLLPPSFNNMFFKSSDVHSYNLRSSNQLRSEFSRTTFKKFSICCKGPLLFSSLPSSLVSLNSSSLFKSHLKKHILSTC